jgi:hypothetical protein
MMYAMTPMGMADTLGRCLLTSIQNSSRVVHRQQIDQVHCGLWRFDAL